MADHQHVQMLVDGVDGEWPRRVRARWQHVRFAADFDDVRRMPAARAFAVKSMNRPAFECPDRILDKARLIQCVRVNRDLHVELIGDIEAG